MSFEFDLLIRGGRVVTPDGIRRADIGIAGGCFAKIAPQLAAGDAPIVDAKDGYVFPGIIDAHVHFNEPGRTDWEGLATGSAALAAGGGTCFFDMPLNSEPPVLDAASFAEKRRLAEAKSRVDFALWGGLTPRNLDQLEALRDAGAIGLKAFMSASGIDSFPRADAATLREGMKRAASLGMIVAVHAEDDALAAKLAAEQKSRDRTDASAWLDSRPVEVELAAIRQALEFAGETRCALHIVHVSSPEGLALVREGKARGVNVTAETCPHYLLLNDADVALIGAPAKCAPPIRDEARRQSLWRDLQSGLIDTIGSDHSPAPASLKTSPDFFAIWGGIAGIQHGFELLLSQGTSNEVGRVVPNAPLQDIRSPSARQIEHNPPSRPDASAFPSPAPGTPEDMFTLFAALLAANVARRFRLAPAKGTIVEGADADCAIIALDSAREITAPDLLTRHKISAYLGRRSSIRITHTFVRGRPAWSDRALAEPPPRGCFLRPVG